MTGPKTNERPGTRATLRGYHMSASKARVVLNLIRGEDVKSAAEILAGTTREAANVIAKVLASAVANAVNNDSMDADELYVSAAYADEGITMKRFTPRARGRAGQIRKRACHITVIVSRLDEDRLELLRVARSAQAAASRSRRVATSRRRSEPAPAAPAKVEEVESDLAVAEVETTQPENVDETLNDQALDETSAEETVSEDTTEETK
jgi:large subunit ribosomal protein L22